MKTPRICWNNVALYYTKGNIAILDKNYANNKWLMANKWQITNRPIVVLEISCWQFIGLLAISH
jgi:hypothetical protein